MKKILVIIYFPLVTPCLLVYKLLRGGNQDLINKDIERWRHCTNMHISNNILCLCHLLTFYPEFRSLFYYRIGKWALVLNLFLRRHSVLYIKPKKLEGGLFIQHGFSTIIYAEYIGANCWINQNVTIGHSGKGIPIIGNNVSIGAGAIVIGPIRIGDNVKIGAGAIVVDDVPSNSIIVSDKAHVISK